ncbi:hypothetical protein WDW37_06395 [Bdellovibrionota bacterium FG-1]
MKSVLSFNVIASLLATSLAQAAPVCTDPNFSKALQLIDQNVAEIQIARDLNAAILADRKHDLKGATTLTHTATVLTAVDLVTIGVIAGWYAGAHFIGPATASAEALERTANRFIRGLAVLGSGIGGAGVGAASGIGATYYLYSQAGKMDFTLAFESIEKGTPFVAINSGDTLSRVQDLIKRYREVHSKVGQITVSRLTEIEQKTTGIASAGVTSRRSKPWSPKIKPTSKSTISRPSYFRG